MLSYEGLAGFWQKLTRRGAPSPAAAWLKERAKATPEQVIEQHFAAMNAHDLEWILSTLAPERVKLYNDHRTLDKRKLSIGEARVLGTTETDEPIPMPAFASRYVRKCVLKVDFELTLTTSRERRDPTLKEGRQWAYYLLVSEGAKKPWLIADWGR